DLGPAAVDVDGGRAIEAHLEDGPPLDRGRAARAHEHADLAPGERGGEPLLGGAAPPPACAEGDVGRELAARGRKEDARRALPGMRRSRREEDRWDEEAARGDERE